MTNDQLQELVSNCPVLFHMSNKNSWYSIQKYGLLSTRELLKLYKIEGVEKARIECQHRPKSVTIKLEGLDDVIIRDQAQTNHKVLQKILPNGFVSSDWYKMLNSKVFFWLSRTKLTEFAIEYGNNENLVLELDTQALIKEFKERVHLCPIHSGKIESNVFLRDRNTFMSIEKFPYNFWKSKREICDCVVELTIEGKVPEINRFLNRAIVQQGDDVKHTFK